MDPDDIAHHSASHLGDCGYRAWSLAKDLRAEYRVQPLDLTSTSWDIAPFLRENHDRIVKERLAARTDLAAGKRQVERTALKFVSG